MCNFLHLRLAKAPGSHGCGADPDTGGDSGLLGVIGDGIFVQSNVVSITTDLQILAGNIHGTQVRQHQVIVGSSGNQVEAFLKQRFCHNLGIASGTCTSGDAAEMDAIAAVVIGGTSMSGGSGKLGGTLIGALIIGILNNGLNLMGVNSDWQYIIKGIVILGAVYVDFIRSSKKSK